VNIIQARKVGFKQIRKVIIKEKIIDVIMMNGTERKK
jgi:hypothetical protein